jgi:hypothetical protein
MGIRPQRMRAALLRALAVECLGTCPAKRPPAVLNPHQPTWLTNSGRNNKAIVENFVYVGFF